MAQHRCTFLVAVHAFVLSKSELLLLERAQTGYMDGYFGVPSGHVERGESITDALVRELREEIGVKLSGKLIPHHVMHRSNPSEERIDYFYVVESWSGEPHNAEPSKCAQLLWAPQDNLPEKTIPYVRKAWELTNSGELFSELREQA